MQYTVAAIVPQIGKYKGKKVFYAKPQPTRTISFEEVVADISEMSTLTSGDVRNAIDRLGYYLRRELSVGNTVQLGELGTFGIVAPSRQVEREEEVTASIVRTPRVRLYLGKELRAAARSLPISVLNPKNVSTSTPPATSPSASGGGTSSGHVGL